MQDSLFVTIIMPIRNEADFIERAIRSVLNNDYPAEQMEILVVDGMSNDGTREIVVRLSQEDNRVIMLDNPKRIAPVAMNIGLKAARGDLFIRVDGHVEIPVDFIAKSICCLHKHPDALEDRQGWMALVQVEGGWLDAQGLQHTHPSHAQHHLLPQPLLGITDVQLVGDTPIPRLVDLNVWIQQI